MVLERIKKPNDIKKLNDDDLNILRKEIRRFLIDSVSETGGHLASNLGVVELTMALHLEFTLPDDKIVWDVGHQSYTHKILTGRKDGFANLRQYGGMSGFPKTIESDCDCFNTGHSSTSISAGLGLASARQINGDNYHVVSVIGDGALTGGLAFEALNNATNIKSNFIIVLNDNNMSISENVGGMSQYLAEFRSANMYRDLKRDVRHSLNSIPLYGEKFVKTIKNTKDSIKQLFIPGMMFEEMGITYFGPVDGNNLTEIRKLLAEAKKINGPVMVHVLSHKGSGYEPAERNPSRFHGTEPFVVKTGLPKKEKSEANYTDVFATVMKKLGESDDKLVAITAAMSDGTGLKRFSKLYPERFYDVGIAEEHAVTFAAGLAMAGLTPVFAVYSSFLQRAYDQILHDVCTQNLHVVFAIDRAGIVGSDGETHQGIFDISFLSSIPNLTVMAPKNKWELADMLKYAIDFDGPIAVRYPRGTAYSGLKDKRKPIEQAKSELIICGEGDEVGILALGTMVETGEEVCSILAENGISATLVNARFAMPFDKDCVRDLAEDHKLIVTLEENVLSGGFGEHVAAYVMDEEFDTKILNIGIPNMFVEHGSVAQLKKDLGLDAKSIAKRIMEKLK